MSKHQREIVRLEDMERTILYINGVKCIIENNTLELYSFMKHNKIINKIKEFIKRTKNE